MIKRAKMVKLVTVGGYNCTIVVKNSHMSAKKMRRILSKHGGKDCENYCWFEEQSQYLSAVQDLTNAGCHAHFR